VEYNGGELMPVDFIQHINDNTNLTAQQKTDLLDDFCECYGYQETIDGEPNPTSKKDFANDKAKRYFIESVNSVRKRTAEDAVEWTELDLDV